LDAPTAAKGDRPWADGVPDARQKAALELFRQGNEKFVRGDHTGALSLYQQALKEWDHPAIRFNASQALVNLDRTVEAYEYAVRALDYGAAPLGDGDYARAVTHLKMLEKQVVRVTVVCKEPGATVTLDGTPLFEAPGSAERVLLPGRHQVVVRKPGRLTATQELTLFPGEPTNLEMKTLEIPPPEMKRRWTTWKPWVVVGSGAAVALIGAGLQLHATSQMNQYDDDLKRLCPNGCRPEDLPSSTRNLKSSSETESVIAISLIGVGGAAAITGAILVFMNQPRPVEVDSSKGRTISVTPILTPTETGIGLSMDF
jgi:hypothetical protein